MVINVIYLTTVVISSLLEQDITCLLGREFKKAGFDLTFVTASETFVKMWVCKLLQ